MILQDTFLKIFKYSDSKKIQKISDNQLINFFKVIRKLLILKFATDLLPVDATKINRRNAFLRALMHISSKYEFPLLKKIADSSLDIYRFDVFRKKFLDDTDIDNVLVNRFVSSIKNEIKIRRGGILKQKDAQKKLLRLITTRIETYKTIFVLTKYDIDQCKKAAERVIRNPNIASARPKKSAIEAAVDDIAAIPALS